MNAFLIDTQSLTPDERKKALELLNISCFMSPSMIGSRPSVFMALTELPAKYIEDSQAKRDIISVPSLSAYISALLPHLQQDCYARAINAAVAYELYPLFRDNPSLWRIVLHLHELRPDFSLEEAVAFLCSASSVPPTVSRQLRRLLCQ